MFGKKRNQKTRNAKAPGKRGIVAALLLAMIVNCVVIGSVAVSLNDASRVFTGFRFQALWTAHLTLLDAVRVRDALKVAIVAPDRPAGFEVVSEAVDYAYIRFYAEDRDELLGRIPEYAPIYPQMRRLIDAMDAELKLGLPFDAARLQSIQTDLVRIIADMSLVYYGYGRDTNAQVVTAGDTLSQLSLRVGLVLSLFFLLAIVATLLHAKQRETTRQLKYQSHHDALTGLKNRNWLHENNEAMFDAAHLNNAGIDLFLIDLDHFKKINDTYGHDMGDAVLQYVADALRPIEQEGKIAALRLGGDELALLAVSDDANQAEVVREQIETALNVRTELRGHHVHIRASIGVAVYPIHGGEYETLSRHADLALYRAKQLGRGQLVVYEPGSMGVAEAQDDMRTRLRSGLQNEEFELVWQPIFDLRTAALSGAEAYLRWRDPKENRLLLPEEFLPEAQRSDLIFDIDRLALVKACAEAAAWEAEFGAHFIVSVNISALNLQAENFPDYLAGIARRAGLTPGLLELDISEGELAKDRNIALKVIHRIRKLGFRVAIDDFGKGMADLHYLAEIEVERLKIDGSFLKGIDISERKQALVTSIIGTGRCTGAEIVAEEVETSAQMEFLYNNDCDFAQGHLLGKPMETEEIRGYLRRKSSETKPQISAA